FKNKGSVIGLLEILMNRVEEPKSRIYGVVFRLPTLVWKAVRKHTLIAVLEKRRQNFSSQVKPFRRKGQTRQADHGIPTPVGEPVVVCDDRRGSISAGDDERICS